MTKMYRRLVAGMILSLTLSAFAPLARGQTLPYTWGNNGFGQLGNNNTVQQNLPVPVTATGVLLGKTVVALAAGENHSLALCSDGTVATWGWNLYGQLGNNSTTGSLVPGLINTAGVLANNRVAALAAGQQHSLVLCTNGTVVAWGYNFSGELGNGSTTQSLVPVAVNTAGALANKTVVAIAAGYAHSLALCSDGTVAAWGQGNAGQLGNNSTAQSLVPVAVNTASGLSVLFGRPVAAIAAGDSDSLALCVDGTLAAWGQGTYGQLGNNTTANSLVPVAVITAGTPLAGKTVATIAAGSGHSLALCSDGTLAGWGRNSEGQLGDNTTTQRNAPVAVNTSTLAAGTLFTRVFSGSSAFHTLALAAAQPALPPQIIVRGLSVTILNGDLSPTGGDYTAFFDLAACSGGSITHAFKIFNFGNGPLTVTGITSSNPSEFAVPSLGSPVVIAGGGAWYDFAITFTANAPGPRTATISIASNDLSANPYIFAVSGNGIAPEIEVAGGNPLTPIPDGALVPSPVNGTDFGSIVVNSSSLSHTFTITNSGTAPLHLTGTPIVVISGLNPGDFTVTQPTVTVIAVGGTTTFTVIFHPSAAGLRTATLSIANDDCDEGIYDFALQGNGTAAAAPLVLACATNKTVNCGTAWTFDPPTASGGCSGALAGVPAAVTVTTLSTVTNGICPMLITRTWQATDACRNTATCSQTVTVVDTTPPVFNCPTNKIVQCGTAWTFDTPTATDNCSPGNAAGPALLPVTILSTVTNGICPMLITRTWQATDPCTNRVTCTQTVTVVDTTVPVISSVPSGGNLGCNPASLPTDASVKLLVNATDNCSVPTINVSHADLSTGCAMRRTFTITASDACLNISAASTVVYTWTTDTTAPVIASVPSGGNLGCNPAILPTDASVKLLVSATDNCGVPTITVSHADLSTGCAIRRTFTITASDACLNTSAPRTVVYTWTADVLAPQIDCPTNTVIVAFDSHCQILIPTFHPKATDNCTPKSQLVYTQTPPAGTLLPGPCQLVTVTVTDACGNSSKCQISVCGEDKTPPNVICPPSITVTDCLVPNVLPLVASDNCTPSNQLVFTQSPSAGTPIAAGVNQVSVTVRDLAGNITTCIISLITSGPQSFLGSMFNTGVNSSKVVMLGGAIDSHYTLGPVPLGTPTGLNLYNAPNAIVAPSWALPPFNLSAWITPAADSLPFLNGSYTYTNRFTLPAGANSATASISGKWAADNGAKMYLNGNQVSSIAPPLGYNQWTPFTLNSGFLPFPAVNTILFVVTNQDPYTGLRVEIKNAVINCSTCAPPAIVWMTPNLSRPVYSTASFTVGAGGTPAFSYQWYRNGALLLNSSHYPGGVSNPTLTIAPPLNSADAGTYKVVISNPCGQTTAASNLTITHGWPWPWGWWNFAQIGNPLAATVGPDLIMTGANRLGISSGTTEDFGLPTIGGKIANVMHVPALPANTLIQLPFVGLGPDRTNVSSYTLIMDVYAPSNSTRSASTLFDSSGPGKDGLRLLMEPSEPMGTNNGITVTGTVGGVRLQLQCCGRDGPDSGTNYIPPVAWSRVVFVVGGGPDNSVLDAAFDANSVVSLYLNGQPKGSITVATGPGLALDWGSNPPTLFSSRAGTSGESYVSSVLFLPFAMTPEMIAVIGSAEDRPIPADDTDTKTADGGTGTCDPGKVIWVDQHGTGIYRSDLNGVNPQLVYTFGLNVNTYYGGEAVAIDSVTGKIYFGDNSTSPGKVMKADSTGANPVVVATTPAGGLSSGRVANIAVGGGMVYWADWLGEKIYRASIGGGAPNLIASVSHLLGLALDLRPSVMKLYYFDSFGNVYRADLNGSNQELLYTFFGMSGFALDTCNDKIYMILKTTPRPGVPVAYIATANLSDGSGFTTILSGDGPVGLWGDDRVVYIALDLQNQRMYWTSENLAGHGQTKSADMVTGNGITVIATSSGAGASANRGIALCLPAFECSSTTTFANKDFQNNSGRTVDGMEWLVQGTYSSVVSHYDGPYPQQPNSTFSSFAIVPAGANTLLRWSGGASIPNGGFAHVGFTVSGSSLTTLGASWTIGGVSAGCAHQVSVGDGFSHVTGEVVFRNTATDCESRVLYVGNIRLEWFATMVPLAELSINGARRPLRVDDVSSPPVALAPGGSAPVKVPLPPLGARFAMIRYTVSASPILAGPGNTIDYQEVQLQSLIEAPAITLQPQGQTATIGSSVTFSVTATGPPPLSYQWRFNNTNIPGATLATYTIFNAQAINAGIYDVVVYDASGSVKSTSARLMMKNNFFAGQNSDGTLSIVWPPNEGWKLQESISLFGPWSDSASQSSPVNLRPSGLNKFYRLVKP